MDIQEFTDKELQVIALIAPEMTPTQLCSKVLRDWYTVESDRLFRQGITPEQKADIIIASAEEVAQPTEEEVKPVL